MQNILVRQHSDLTINWAQRAVELEFEQKMKKLKFGKTRSRAE
jgi:hypothetical protein